VSEQYSVASIFKQRIYCDLRFCSLIIGREGEKIETGRLNHERYYAGFGVLTEVIMKGCPLGYKAMQSLISQQMFHR
jgi:hypothetical protein